MRRREFITLLGGAAAVWPLRARAQQLSGRPLIGILSPQPETAAAPNFAALRQGLRELGYFERHNIWLEFRYADGVAERLPALAGDIVAREPDLIIAGSAAGVLAVQGATRTIPIVMFSILDPVALGVVKSISRPGGNVTGIWTFGGGNDALVSKRVELLKEIVPQLSRVGVLASADDPSDAISLSLLPAATRALGVDYKVFDVSSTSELGSAFTRAKREGMPGMFVTQRSFHVFSSSGGCGGGRRRPPARRLRLTRTRRGRRADLLWGELGCRVSSERPIAGQNLERCKPCRFAGRATDTV